jgi:hypothetical protein
MKLLQNDNYMYDLSPTANIVFLLNNSSLYIKRNLHVTDIKLFFYKISKAAKIFIYFSNNKFTNLILETSKLFQEYRRWGSRWPDGRSEGGSNFIRSSVWRSRRLQEKTRSLITKDHPVILFRVTVHLPMRTIP